MWSLGNMCQEVLKGVLRVVSIKFRELVNTKQANYVTNEIVLSNFTILFITLYNDSNE